PRLACAAPGQACAVQSAVAPRVLGFQGDRGAALRLVGRPGQRQPELRPAAGLAPRLEPAAVQPGVLQGDGQPQAGPAGGAGPGRVGPPEAAEDAGGLAGLESDAVVADGHGDRAPGGRQAHDDVLALAVFHGVDHEVAQDAFHAPGVGLGDDGLLVAQDPDAGALAFGERFGPADHAPDDLAQVYRLRLQCRRARVEAADLQEVRE